MSQRTTIPMLVGLAVALAPMAYAIGIPAGLKSTKMKGTLVPAFAPQDSGSGTGDDEGDSPAFVDTAVARTGCTFTKGSYKIQVGKDASVQLAGVTCGGTPVTGTLCAHTKVLATIMNEEIDASGGSTAKACSSTAGDIAGLINWSSGNVGTITCTAGKCKGTLPTVATDPCPDVDKVAEVRRIEVFNGPDFANVPVLGTALKVCCGPHQTLVGGISPSGSAPCNTSTQDVMGEAGTVTQGVQ